MKEVEKKTVSYAGYGALLIGVGLFSTIEIASKAISQRAVVDPIGLVFVRFFSTGLVLLALFGKDLFRRMKGFGRRDYGLFLLNGFIGITLSITVFHIAILVFANASSSAVVFSANPVFVVILARFVNGESWTREKWLAVTLGLVGIACFAWESGSLSVNSLYGMLLMSLSAFLFAFSICLSKRVMSRYGPVLFMGFSALFGSLLLLPVCIMRWTPEAGTQAMNVFWLIAYVSLVGTAAAYGCYYFGISKTTAYHGSMTFFLKPVLASVLSYFILSERPNIHTIVGTCLIFAGLILSVSGSRKPRSAVTGNER